MNADAFLNDFHHVATIGATPDNGVDRQAATPEDKQVRDWFRAAAEEAGLSVRVDGIGNVFAVSEWTPGAACIVVGSHLDSQPRGGRFDGAYGVIAGLHAAKAIGRELAETGRVPKYNIAVVDWFNEEGGRFAPSVMGSSVYAGLFSEEKMLDTSDLDGVTVRDALESIGYLGRDEPPVAAGYAEVHIEQGRILERERLDIGLVDRSWFTQKLDIEVIGEQSHTGATSMADRRDALVSAAKIILRVREVVDNYDEDLLLSSIGQLVIEPNSPIVVARRVHLVADLRSVDRDIVLGARATLLRQLQAIAEQDGVEVRVHDFDVRPVRRFPIEAVELADSVARGVGYTTRVIQTRAGHDSVAMNTLVPSVMLFVPSVGGVSHCESEFTSDDDLVQGLEVLTGVVRRMLDGALDGVHLPEGTAVSSD
ncbi:M20 family metallo-hydrolase [Microbacterium sp. PMB16]|uniref:M20 family metallo-hydrolase n=1 Tax=Microbacterium sp. PMB16 TaxID=3120157 RepID=UPI003F4B8F84